MGGGERNFYLFCPISSFLPQNNRQFFPLRKEKVKQYKEVSGDFLRVFASIGLLLGTLLPRRPWLPAWNSRKETKLGWVREELSRKRLKDFCRLLPSQKRGV